MDKGHSTFVGMGRNPEQGVPDMPLGFGFSLAEHENAMNTYASLTNEQKTQVIQYVEGGRTGEEAKARVTNAVKMLGDGDTSFF